MTHGRPPKTEKCEPQTHTYTPTLAHKPHLHCAEADTCLWEHGGLKWKTESESQKHKRGQKEACTHMHTQDKGNLFPSVEKAEKKVCISISMVCIYASVCVSVCVSLEASAWKLIIVAIAVRTKRARLPVNIVGRCHSKQRNYLSISAQLCTHLRSLLPLSHLYHLFTPLSSPQPSARWKLG